MLWFGDEASCTTQYPGSVHAPFPRHGKPAHSEYRFMLGLVPLLVPAAACCGTWRSAASSSPPRATSPWPWSSSPSAPVRHCSPCSPLAAPTLNSSGSAPYPSTNHLLQARALPLATPWQRQGRALRTCVFTSHRFRRWKVPPPRPLWPQASHSGGASHGRGGAA